MVSTRNRDVRNSSNAASTRKNLKRKRKPDNEDCSDGEGKVICLISDGLVDKSTYNCIEYVNLSINTVNLMVFSENRHL